MKGGEILDVESVAHKVLGGWNVDDVCVVVDALENLEGAIMPWLEFGISVMWEPILAQMNPNKVAFLEDVWSLVLVDLCGMAIDLFFNCLPCVVMQVLHDVGSLGDVHVDALVKW
jgi:hypothetical protein